MENPDHLAERDLPEYQSFEAEWQGIALEIRHCRRWLCGHGEQITQHIEIRAAGKVPLPVTETGYRSQFMHGADALAAFGDDPVAYVLAWLNEAAKDPQWTRRAEERRQYSLF